MAKLVFFLVALLFLFSFSHALTPSDLPEKETNGRDLANTKFPESETKPATAILLPSEKRDSEPAKDFEWIPEAAATKLPDSDGPTILANEESTEFTHSESVPLTVISFRPVNRHFPRRPFPLSFRHGHRCRHGRRHVGPWSPRFHGGERDRDAVPYGNDMILGDDLAFDPVFRGLPRQIPPRWGSFRHGGPRFPFRHDDDMELERPHHHHHHRHDREHDREEFEGMEKPREHRHEHEREHEGGLMRKFRKFLNRF